MAEVSGKARFWPKTINTLPALAALYERLSSEIIKMGIENP